MPSLRMVIGVSGKCYCGLNRGQGMQSTQQNTKTHLNNPVPRHST